MVATPPRCTDGGGFMAPRLSAGEREEIGLGRAAGESIRSIARRLGRQPSTISREVARFECYGQSYKPAAADWAAWLRHRRARRPARLAVDGPLRGLVIGLLRRRWSPRQIAARLRLDYPDQSELHVSHETIYQAIYLQSRATCGRS
ncbi:transposase [Micromonospora haikouensis]|uniref:transposase n=1 Tax=Micromonospora haikouensis TaxID=686309 RepID=UPI003787BD46